MTIPSDRLWDKNRENDLRNGSIKISKLQEGHLYQLSDTIGNQTKGTYIYHHPVMAVPNHLLHFRNFLVYGLICTEDWLKDDKILHQLLTL